MGEKILQFVLLPEICVLLKMEKVSKIKPEIDEPQCQKAIFLKKHWTFVK